MGRTTSVLVQWILVITAGVILAGYAAATRASAQNQALPFTVGDTISLRYESAARPCRVEAIRGQFVKCQNEPDENWFNLNATIFIAK
jgi:hypothetical protein